MVVITWRETAEPIAAEEYANEVIIPVAWLIDCVKRLEFSIFSENKAEKQFVSHSRKTSSSPLKILSF